MSWDLSTQLLVDVDIFNSQHEFRDWNRTTRYNLEIEHRIRIQFSNIILNAMPKLVGAPPLSIHLRIAI